MGKSVISGSASGKGDVLGADSSYNVEGDVLSGSAEASITSGVEYEEGTGKVDSVDLVDASASAKVTGAHAEEKGNIGYVYGEAEETVLSAEASAGAKATLVEDGELAPQLKVEAKGEASVASGEAELGIGVDDYNAHAKADGTLLGAEANAGAGIGKITYEDEDGNKKTDYGAYAEVGAEAYLAKGSLSGGITIAGINFDITVEGKAGGGGASAEASVTTGNLEAGLGLGLIFGLGAKVTIDWSDFKWPWSKKDDKGSSSADDVGKNADSKNGKKSHGGGGGSHRADFTVEPSKLEKHLSALDRASSELKRCSSDINDVKSNLEISSSAYGLIQKSLTSVKERISMEQKSAKQMHDMLEQICNMYVTTENNIAGF